MERYQATEIDEGIVCAATWLSFGNMMSVKGLEAKGRMLWEPCPLLGPEQADPQRWEVDPGRPGAGAAAAGGWE